MRIRGNKRPTILVTAGPTKAYLDDVRFISNFSTGGVGFEICRSLRRRQFSVVAVVGSTSFDFKSLKLKELIRVETNREMLDEVIKAGRKYRPAAAVFSAAVLDFEPTIRLRKKVSSQKPWRVELVPAPKIIDAFKKRYPIVQTIEFKLESKKFNHLKLGRTLLKKRGGLAVCLNRIGDIKGDKHRAILISRNGSATRLSTKSEIGDSIATLIQSEFSRVRPLF